MVYAFSATAVCHISDALRPILKTPQSIHKQAHQTGELNWNIIYKMTLLENPVEVCMYPSPTFIPGLHNSDFSCSYLRDIDNIFDIILFCFMCV